MRRRRWRSAASMRGLQTFASLAIAFAAAPVLADDHVTAAEETALDEAEVRIAVMAFMNAIGSDDKTDLAGHMIPEAMIFVHNRMDPGNPRVDLVPVAQHLERWATRTASI